MTTQTTQGKLAGKVALITGGTSGIGLATAQRFLEEGATVIVTGRTEANLAQAAEVLGERAHVVRSEASDLGQIRALFEEVAAEHGQLDALFLNAGLFRLAPLSDLTEAHYDEVFDVNVKGVFFGLSAALPVLRDGAAVVINTSVVNQVGMPGAGVYAASKAAVRSIVRTAAAELAPRKIRVNAISPGPVATPIFGRSQLPEQAAEGMGAQLVAQIPLGRFGQAEEIAAATLFLSTDESSFITGVELAADGGMTQV